MSKTLLQYQLDQKGGSFMEISVPHPTPGPNDICIRTKAVALNPVDRENRDFGATVQSWLAVFGIEAAGVVDWVGDTGKDFKTGDEILCLGGIKGRGAAFQELKTVPSHHVAKKPASLTFEEAAIHLLRLALPSATILTTSFANQHAHLISLGATKCFDRSAQEDTCSI